MSHSTAADVEASLDNPDGSPEQLFSLMLLRRLESLEAAGVERDVRIGDLEARVRQLEVKTYDADGNEFSDGFYVDWFVWERVDTAHACRCDVARPMKDSESYSSAYVTLPMVMGVQTDDIELHVPVARYGDETRTIRIPRDERLDARGLLERIHAFYMTPITALDIADREHEDSDGVDGYLADVRAKLDGGVPAVWADLLGQSGYRPGRDGSTENRRHGLSCSGLVRYESIRTNNNNELVLVLGS